MISGQDAVRSIRFLTHEYLNVKKIASLKGYLVTRWKAWHNGFFIRHEIFSVRLVIPCLHNHKKDIVMLTSYRDRVYLITFYRHAKHLAVAPLYNREFFIRLPTGPIFTNQKKTRTNSKDVWFQNQTGLVERVRRSPIWVRTLPNLKFCPWRWRRVNPETHH